MKSKFLSTALIFVLIAGMLSGCTGGGTTPAQPTADSAATAAPAASSDAPAGQGEPVKLKAAAMYSNLRPNLDTTSVWDYVKEQLNIEVSVELFNDAEKANLMFASRDFPDFAMGVPMNAQQMADAAEAGDLVALDDLLPEHAPLWHAFLAENPMARNALLGADGKLYTLPFIDYAPNDRELRDQWFITDRWLNELGLEIPTTTEEFKAVLQAFKDNAGKGSIPAEAAPYYFLFDNYVGGQYDIYGSFGVLVQSGDYLTVFDGKVTYQAVNPDIKEPLKYLRDLYAAGLIPPEVFTDDWGVYTTKISSNPPVVGSYSSYANRLPAEHMPIAPLQSPNGKAPMMRKQAYGANSTRGFYMFANNPDYAATLSLCDLAATPEGTMNIGRGKQGVVWDYNENGKAVDIFWEESPDLMAQHAADLGLHNSFIALRDREFHANFFYEKGVEQERSRPWAYENVYKDYIPAGDVVYVGGTLSTDDAADMSLLGTDIENYRKQTFADWISGKGDIDADWDAYVAHIQSLQLDKWLGYKQAAYDLMIK